MSYLNTIVAEVYKLICLEMLRHSFATIYIWNFGLSTEMLLTEMKHCLKT